MNDVKKKTGFWKHKVGREIIDYCLNFIYLACFFGLFSWYRRLILASYQIAYLDYGIAIVKAAVLAKVLMVGQVLGLGRRLEKGPLILPVLYKTVVFSLLVGLFSVVEHAVKGFLLGRTPAAEFHQLVGRDSYELLARCLVVFFAFVPFFAVKELGRVLGEGVVGELFFRRRAGS